MVVNVFLSSATVGNCNRHEIVKWVNRRLQTNIAKVEDLCTGSEYCQLMNILFPHCVNMRKVKLNSRNVLDCLHNFKLLQVAFNSLKIDKHFSTEKLVRGTFQHNLEFAQWFVLFFNSNYAGQVHDPVEMRDTYSGKGPNLRNFGSELHLGLTRRWEQSLGAEERKEGRTNLQRATGDSPAFEMQKSSNCTAQNQCLIQTGGESTAHYQEAPYVGDEMKSPNGSIVKEQPFKQMLEKTVRTQLHPRVFEIVGGNYENDEEGETVGKAAAKNFEIPREEDDESESLSDVSESGFVDVTMHIRDMSVKLEQCKKVSDEMMDICQEMDYESKPEGEIQKLKQLNKEFVLVNKILNTERCFFYSKLRNIEILCEHQSFETNPLAAMIRNILCSTEMKSSVFFILNSKFGHSPF